jgi:hypothetical protein
MIEHTAIPLKMFPMNGYNRYPNFSKSFKNILVCL